jgi:DNA helicase-2/ATP-dependent DNA helicase PcrA
MPEEHLVALNAPRPEPRFAESPPAPVTDGDEPWPLRVGDRVRHARWGEGLVVGLERDGSDVVVTVGFASVGRKKLSLQYAHLEAL